jgi:hypothetical protein
MNEPCSPDNISHSEVENESIEAIRTLLALYPKGSVGHFIARAGERFHLPATAPAVERDPPKRCFENATRRSLAFFGPFGYAEGYACPPGLIPVYHAWNYDLISGEVIDTTLGWRPGAAYLGTRIGERALRSHVYRTGCVGALVEADGWTPSPLVRAGD